MRAVVFDCDGVLVDSEPLAWEVWSQIVAAVGYQADDADYEAVVGLSDRATYEYFAERAEMPAADDVAAVRRRMLFERFSTRLQPFPDAVETVRGLAGYGVPIAVATSSVREELAFKLDVTDLARYFTVSVAADEVSAAKPAPDVYLAAAAGLGVAPGDCLAIEDSLVGVAAASAAGMRVVAVARDGRLPATVASVARLEADAVLAWLA